LANGVAAHALDFDDTSYAGLVHSSAAVLPAVLAAGEYERVSGATLLTAFIAGSEVEMAFGLALSNSIYARGWWTTSVLGAIGAAAGTARVLGLDGRATSEAISLAAGHAAGLRGCLGTPAKPYYSARAAEFGLQAAKLSRLGPLGMPDMLAGDHGFVRMFNDGHIDEQAFARLGNVYSFQTPGIAIKRYPVCSAAQAAMEAVSDVIAKHNLSADDVARIDCEVTPLVADSLRYHLPVSVTQAQFSMPFAVGSILAFGRLEPELLTENILTNSRLVRAMDKVNVVVASDTGYPSAYDESPEGAFITVESKDGDRFSQHTAIATGMPSKPMTDLELEHKFRACTRGILTAEQSSRWIERITHLEELDECGDVLEP
jgi:2-methylcitrate dehydratase PrpD